MRDDRIAPRLVGLISAEQQDTALAEVTAPNLGNLRTATAEEALRTMRRIAADLPNPSASLLASSLEILTPVFKELLQKQEVLNTAGNLVRADAVLCEAGSGLIERAKNGPTQEELALMEVWQAQVDFRGIASKPETAHFLGRQSFRSIVEAVEAAGAVILER